MVRVVADLGWQVEGDAQPCYALGQQIPVAPVGFLRRGEARVLPHGPRPASVHRGLTATRERELTGSADVVWAHVTGPILPDGHRPDS